MHSDKSNVRPRGTDNARVISVIETKSLRGLGTENDPVRWVYQYWNFEGKLLAECDTLNEAKENEVREYTKRKATISWQS